MVQVKITDSAYNDLLAIEEYISKDSPNIARSFINKIFNKIEILYNYKNFQKVYIDKESHAVAWSEDIDICPDNAYIKLANI
jgi:hypothetical protein